MFIILTRTRHTHTAGRAAAHYIVSTGKQISFSEKVVRFSLSDSLTKMTVVSYIGIFLRNFVRKYPCCRFLVFPYNIVYIYVLEIQLTSAALLRLRHCLCARTGSLGYYNLSCSHEMELTSQFTYSDEMELTSD